MVNQALFTAKVVVVLMLIICATAGLAVLEVRNSGYSYDVLAAYEAPAAE